MIVKLIAPGIIPNDYVTVDLPGVPQRGDTVLVQCTHPGARCPGSGGPFALGSLSRDGEVGQCLVCGTNGYISDGGTVESHQAGRSTETETLTVTGVSWPVKIRAVAMTVATASMPEVTCGRTPDAPLSTEIYRRAHSTSDLSTD